MDVHRDAAARFRRAPRRQIEPVEAIRIQAIVMRAALALAEGDARRLRLARDGSVLVRNNP